MKIKCLAKSRIPARESRIETGPRPRSPHMRRRGVRPGGNGVSMSVSASRGRGGGLRKERRNGEEHHPGRDTGEEDRYTKRAVTLYIADGEAQARA